MVGDGRPESTSNEAPRKLAFCTRPLCESCRLRPGTMVETSSNFSTLFLRRSSEVTALTTFGTSCRRSSLRRALTMMSPEPTEVSPASLAGAVCASAGVVNDNRLTLAKASLLILSIGQFILTGRSAQPIRENQRWLRSPLPQRTGSLSKPRRSRGRYDPAKKGEITLL